MKTILICGGVGFIGTNITIEAIKRGYKVIAFDNLSRTGVKDNLTYLQDTYKDKFKFIWGDVRKAGDFEKLPKVDAVINLAANPSVVNSIKYPGYDFETNCGGVVNSLDFIRSRGNVPYLYASTNKVYSDITNEIPVIEEGNKLEWMQGGDYPQVMQHGVETNLIPDHGFLGTAYKDEGLMTTDILSINDKFPVDGFGKYGHSLYGIGKLAGELYCQEYHVQFKVPMVIFRMSCIFGLFQKGVCEQGWIDWFLRQIAFGNGKIIIFGTGKQVRDVLDGRDVARAYLDALESISQVNGEIFTLGGGPDNTYSLLEAITVIEEITGKKAKLTFKEKRPADQDIYISSIKKIKEKLGWQPKIKLQSAIKDMLEQYEKA